MGREAAAPTGVHGLGDLTSLSRVHHLLGVLKLWEEMAELRRTVAAQRDEIARLKGGSGRPNIKPSGMDQERLRDRVGITAHWLAGRSSRRCR
jgi:hypothetical protein